MGSSNSKEKELNEDLERIRKERVKARQREEKEREEKEREEKERHEKERVANSKLIRIKFVSPAPGYEIEIRELETVLALLEKFALLLGLTKSAAKSLQLEFSETALAHELQLEPAGLCDESLCSVLGPDGSVLNVDSMVKANAVDIVYAAEQNQVAEVRLVCQYAPEKVNDKDSVMLLVCMLKLILLGLWDRLGTQLFTSLPATTGWRWLNCFWEQELQLMPKAM